MIYHWNKTAQCFPSQSGKPVLITEEQFQYCCCVLPGTDLLTYFPSVRCPIAPPDRPHPNNPLVIGPFETDKIIRLETDVQCYYDDKLMGGIGRASAILYTEWFGEDGIRTRVTLADPLPAGEVYVLEVWSTKSSPPAPDQRVGVEISPTGQSGTYSKITWYDE